MKIIFTMVLIILFNPLAFCQLYLTPTEVLNSSNNYNNKFICLLGSVSELETFFNIDNNEAMKFKLYDKYGNYINVRVAIKQGWLSDGSTVQVSGTFYEDYGYSLEQNLLFCDQNKYGESILPYEEDKTMKVLDGLLRLLKK